MLWLSLLFIRTDLGHCPSPPQNEGVLALYRGASSRIVGSALCCSVLFGTNGEFKRCGDTVRQSHETHLSNKGIAGGRNQGREKALETADGCAIVIFGPLCRLVEAGMVMDVCTPRILIVFLLCDWRVRLVLQAGGGGLERPAEPALLDGSRHDRGRGGDCLYPC